MIFHCYRGARCLPWLALLALAGCAGAPADRGLGDIGAQLQERGAPALTAPDDPQGARLLDELLARTPLTRDDAVRVALLANAKLQDAYARLGLSGADLYSAARPDNPTLSAGALFGGGAEKYSLGLAQSLVDLLLLPARTRLAGGEFERIKLTVGSELIEFIHGVEASYYRAVGAAQVAQLRTATHNAAAAAAELAQRFFAAGNISRLQLELAQAEAGRAQLALLAAQSALSDARADLNEQLGLGAGRNRWTTVERLSLPVAAEDDLAALQQLAERQRLDLAAQRRELELLEDYYGIARSTRLLGSAELGIEGERETDGEHLAGPTLAVQLPLFHQGQGAQLRARAQLEASRARLAALQNSAGNAVARAHARVAATRAVVLLYQRDIVPQRERIVALTQEQANYMLAGPFELIRAKQDEYDAYQLYIEALRDYWLARVELARSIGARLPSDARIVDPPAQPQQPQQSQQPQVPDEQHHHHH